LQYLPVEYDTSYNVTLHTEADSALAYWDLWMPKSAANEEEVEEEVEGAKADWILRRSEKMKIEDSRFDLALPDAAHMDRSYMIGVHIEAARDSAAAFMPAEIRWNLVFHNARHDIEIPFVLQKVEAESALAE
jgi:hypothetical protein